MSEEIKVSEEARDVGEEIYSIYEVRTDYECTCFSKPEDPCSFCNGWAKAKKEGTERIQILLNQRDTKIAALEAEVGELRKDRSEFINWILHQNITSENIGNIRRQCFMPYDCSWNAFVRDETAARENTALNSTKGEK